MLLRNAIFFILQLINAIGNKVYDLLFPEWSSSYGKRPVRRHPGWQNTDDFAGGAVWVQTSKSQVEQFDATKIRKIDQILCYP